MEQTKNICKLNYEPLPTKMKSLNENVKSFRLKQAKQLKNNFKINEEIELSILNTKNSDKQTTLEKLVEELTKESNEIKTFETNIQNFEQQWSNSGDLETKRIELIKKNREIRDEVQKFFKKRMDLTKKIYSELKKNKTTLYESKTKNIRIEIGVKLKRIGNSFKTFYVENMKKIENGIVRQIQIRVDTIDYRDAFNSNRNKARLEELKNIREKLEEITKNLVVQFDTNAYHLALHLVKVVGEKIKYFELEKSKHEREQKDSYFLFY